MFKDVKLSNVLMFLVLGQFVYTLMIASGQYQSNVFSSEHEDTIFVMHLMAWFIVRAIENISITLEVNTKQRD